MIKCIFAPRILGTLIFTFETGAVTITEDIISIIGRISRGDGRFLTLNDLFMEELTPAMLATLNMSCMYYIFVTF